MELYLIRHTSVDVPKDYCYGQLDVPVKETFKQEAELIRQQLAICSFDYVYSSPLSRCRLLAGYCGYPDAILDKRILELNFGDWEGRLWSELTDVYAQQWFDDWVQTEAPNGESFLRLLTRVEIFIQALPQGADKIAVFTHAGVINAVRVVLDKITPLEAFSKTPDYASITLITHHS